jgi:2'-5' RNA ligase
VTRAFVAVRLPEVVLDAVDRRVADLSVPGRRTTREQWHLTLQFLGDDVDVDAVVGALADVDARRGRARLGGVGAFPDAAGAHVFWLGLAEGSKVLADIAKVVAERTARLGYEADTRPFRPHVTLARCRSAADLRALIAAVGNEPVGPAWEIDAVTVYESRRLADGARYVERAAIPLKSSRLPA